MTQELFVNLKGEPINFNGGGPSFKRAARPKSEAPQEFHKGFKVVGHRPGSLEFAREFANKARAEWSELSQEERSKRLCSGLREPPMWVEEKWRAETKKSAVRSRPYEVHEAAELCKQIAEGQGWLDVVVLEVKRANASSQQEAFL